MGLPQVTIIVLVGTGALLLLTHVEQNKRGIVDSVLATSEWRLHGHDYSTVEFCHGVYDAPDLYAAALLANISFHVGESGCECADSSNASVARGHNHSKLTPHSTSAARDLKNIISFCGVMIGKAHFGHAFISYAQQLEALSSLIDAALYVPAAAAVTLISTILCFTRSLARRRYGIAPPRGYRAAFGECCSSLCCCSPCLLSQLLRHEAAAACSNERDVLTWQSLVSPNAGLAAETEVLVL